MLCQIPEASMSPKLLLFFEAAGILLFSLLTTAHVPI